MVAAQFEKRDLSVSVFQKSRLSKLNTEANGLMLRDLSFKRILTS